MVTRRIYLDAQSEDVSIQKRRGYGTVLGVRLSLGPIAWTDTSVARAKRIIGEVIKSFLDAYQQPKLISLGGYTAVISVEPTLNGPSFRYDTIGPDGHQSVSAMAMDTFLHAEESARWNIAQMVVDFHNDESVHRCAAFLQSDDSSYGQRSFYRYCSWQRAARHAMEIGESDPHDYACKHENDEQFRIPPQG